MDKDNEVSMTKVQLSSLKKSEDIKAFAESTMNELLGWYGYDSSRQDNKTQRHCRTFSGSNDSESESVKFTEGCGWCGKLVDESTSVISATAVFCSERCFSQSRRASFKRNKTCDWCRHTRHSISYVDFQDNAAQLQFCSDKCLNQYKMHIFCRETQAHLELHPHLHKESTASNLITPDLWLKNCSSPQDYISSSIIPEKTATVPESLPLITIAPSSKLLATDTQRNRKTFKRSKKGCSSTITSMSPSTNDLPQDLRVRQTPPLENSPPLNFKMEPCSRITFEESSKQEDPTKPFLMPKLAGNNVREILGNIMPPPTTFVPYPVILPLPIPIPIPIPIPKIFKSKNGKELIEVKDEGTQTSIETESNNNNDNSLSDGIEEKLGTNRRLLRKRKPVERSKSFMKHKKTFST